MSVETAQIPCKELRELKETLKRARSPQVYYSSNIEKMKKQAEENMKADISLALSMLDKYV